MKVRKLSIKSNTRSYGSTEGEQRLIRNVVSNLALSLQQMTTEFRTNQNIYLKKIQTRKERSNMLYDTSQYSSNTSAFMKEGINGIDDYNDDDDEMFQLNRNNNQQTQEQLKLTRLNQRQLEERETEINHVVKSIVDLNEVFKDLATMVVDQVRLNLNKKRRKLNSI
jgi:syntaxin 16